MIGSPNSQRYDHRKKSDTRMDPKIKEAIEMAVTEQKQPDSVSKALVAWMSAITSGKEDPHDASAAARRADILYQETTSTITIDGINR